MTRSREVKGRRAGSGRVGFLRGQWAAKVQERVPESTTLPIERRALRSPEGAFDLLLRIDPSPKKVHLQQLLRWFESGDFRLEDARRTRDLLTRFVQSKQRLAVSARDINRYRVSGDLAEALDRLDGIRAEDPMAFFQVPVEVRDDTRVVDCGRDWLLVELLGEKASGHFASSTSWCTRNPGTFRDYRRRGPLFVAIWPGGRIQFHVTKDNWGQICDERDRKPATHVMATLPMSLRRAMLDCVAQGVSPSDRVEPISVKGAIESIVNSIGGWDIPRDGWFRHADGEAHLVPGPDQHEIVAWHTHEGLPVFLDLDPQGGCARLTPEAYFASTHKRSGLESLAEHGGLPPALLMRMGPDHPAFIKAMRNDGSLLECMKLGTLPSSVDCVDGEFQASRAWLFELDEEKVRSIAFGNPRGMTSLLAGLPVESILTRRILNVCTTEEFLAAAEPTYKTTLDFLKACMMAPSDCLEGVVEVFARLIPRQRADLISFFAVTPHKLALTLAALGSSPFRDRLAPVLVPLAQVGEGDVARFRRFSATPVFPARAASDRTTFHSGFQQMSAAFERYAASNHNWEGAPGPGSRIPVIAAMLLCDPGQPLALDAPEFDSIALVAPEGTGNVAKVVRGDALGGFVLTQGRATRADVERTLVGFRCGHAIGALPLEERTSDLFERAVEMGRGGALSVLPWSVANPDLVARLALVGEAEVMVDPACATPEYLETVLETMRTHPEASGALTAFADNLAIYVWLMANELFERTPVTSSSVPDPHSRVSIGLASGVRFDRVLGPGIRDGVIPIRSVPTIVRNAILMNRSVTSRIPHGELLARAPMANLEAPFTEVPSAFPNQAAPNASGWKGMLRALGLFAGLVRDR